MLVNKRCHTGLEFRPQSNERCEHSFPLGDNEQITTARQEEKVCKNGGKA